MQSKQELNKVGVIGSSFAKWSFTIKWCTLVYGADKYHGVVLIPEGLIESIPEVYALLQVLLLC